ncbi:MAG: hypothetical protein Fur0025_42770 [Oscillatoriaceae cyanobacterium]
MALYDNWVAQRHRRIELTRSRQHQVGGELRSLQAVRQDTAAQVRAQLDDFTAKLRQQRQHLARQSAAAAASRQQLTTERHEAIGDFLRDTASRRYRQGQQQAQQLADFAQTLAQKTAQFLAATQADRSLMAEQLAADLADFHAQLKTTVATNRLSWLQQHAAMRVELKQDLAAFVSELQADVREYLQELELLAEARGRQLRQDLQVSRSDRQATMRELQAQLEALKLNLRQYAQNLRQEVWGSALSVATPPVATAPAPTPAKTVAPPPPPPKTVAPPLPSPPTPIPPGEKGAGTMIPHEAQVYAYIKDTQGARLREIEDSLQLNRVQTVDALRSLMKKELIAQRDRLYVPVDKILN